MIRSPRGAFLREDICDLEFETCHRVITELEPVSTLVSRVSEPSPNRESPRTAALLLLYRPLDRQTELLQLGTERRAGDAE